MFLCRVLTSTVCLFSQVFINLINNSIILAVFLPHIQVVDLQVFQGPQVRREKTVIQAHQAMALKESPVPLDSPDPLAPLDLRALLVCSHRLD